MRITLMFILTLLMFQSLGCPTIEAQPQRLTDKEITLAVATELSIDESVPSHFIDIQTEHGIVVLSGMVDNLLARERARKRAERVKGVRAVVNNLVVKPVERNDAVILTDVKRALLTDPATDAYEVQVSVDQGIVTLRGTVDSWQEKQLSAQVARSVKGIKAVKNELSFTVTEQRLDHEIAMDITRRLAADMWVDEYLITVDVHAGKVTLKGDVGSAMEKSRAVVDAWVTGVRSVDASGLDVKWWAREPMRRTHPFTPQADDDIASAIRAAWSHDPRVSMFHPKLEVDKGVVTLTGRVDNLAAKQAAAEDAKNTVGVWRVRNHLRVRPEPLPSNTALAKQVRMALFRDPYIERYEIGVTVLNGRVYLDGTVDSWFEKTHAAQVAARVAGAVTVVNNLHTLPRRMSKSDWEVKLAIERQLRQSPLLNSDTITVAVEDGMATLTGLVETWLAHNAAIANAYEGGALGVRDRLKVRHGPEDLGS
jgi:osmotically-inducible protein OsmY